MEVKPFACCEVNWTIENFCFAHPPNNCIILSPEFILQGNRTVEWRMSLELESNESSNDGQVSFYFEKLPDSKARNLWVNWEMALTVESKVFGPYERTVDFDEQCNRHGYIGIATTKEILECLPPLKPDNLKIRFYFVFYDKDRPWIPGREPNLSLTLLSKDLSRLRGMDQSYADVKLKVKDDKFIEAHKVILSQNEKFVSCMKVAKNNIIEIPNFDYETIDLFLNFLYSGKVEHYIRNPTISMIKCMEHFNCDVLKPYYIPEKLPMSTKIKIETHEFHWHVADIMDRNSFDIKSPPIMRYHLDTTWQLAISLKADDPDQVISLFAEIVNGPKPPQFCLEFALLNESKKQFFPRRLLRNDKNYENLGFQDFASKREIQKSRSLYFRGSVCFIFRIRTSNGCQDKSIGCHDIVLTSPSPVELKPYLDFAHKISELFNNKSFSDIVVRDRDRRSINAHKCILVARSPGFKRKIENELIDKKAILVGEVDSEILKLSMKYMYGTDFIVEDIRSKASNLYYESAEDKLDIPSLREDSLRHLRSIKAYIYEY